jgi:hypothetical protein
MRKAEVGKKAKPGSYEGSKMGKEKSNAEVGNGIASAWSIGHRAWGEGSVD